MPTADIARTDASTDPRVERIQALLVEQGRRKEWLCRHLLDHADRPIKPSRLSNYFSGYRLMPEPMIRRALELLGEPLTLAA